MKCPYCGVIMRSVHDNLSISKKFQKHNTWKCRRELLRCQRMKESRDVAEAKVLLKAKRGLEYVIERQACGKKWFRSRYAAELEAAGLPPNIEIAAIVLGINMVTLKKRLSNYADLLAPLRTDGRSGREAPVRLKVLFPELVSKLVIYNLSEKRRLKRKIAKVRAEAGIRIRAKSPRVGYRGMIG